MNCIEDKLNGLDGELNIETNVSMKEYTTFKAGGETACLVSPSDVKTLSDIVKLCRKNSIDYYVLGNGSNVLFTDYGYDGLVIHIGETMSVIEEDGDTITAQAGASLPSLAKKAADIGLSGLEFASGIPGSVGGAVVMNAGAYGGEIKDVIAYADVCDNEGNILRLTSEELGLGYRSSIIQEKEYIVCSACFKLKKGDKKEIKEKMNDYNNRRREKQPLSYASAGSTFKRPEGHFAGQLIEQCGLKGFQTGGAKVSEKHAGFVINTGDATASDILEVIRHVQNTVYENTGIKLETEVKIIGKMDRREVNIFTFGYKYGEPGEYDLIVDARGLPNPYYVKELKDKNGNDDEVYDYVMSSEQTAGFIEENLSLILEYIEKNKKMPLVAIGCTGGRHRSVTIARALRDCLLKKEYKVNLKHRDIDK